MSYTRQQLCHMHSAFRISIAIEWSRLFGVPAAVVFTCSYVIFGAVAGPLVGFCILASFLFHEAAHVLVASLNHVEVTALGFSLAGTYIRRRAAQSWRSELTISAAGPLANLLLALLCWGVGGSQGDFLGRINAAIAASNLVPLGATDGNRALDALCRMLALRRDS